jgi:predicted transcriptional regulator
MIEQLFGSKTRVKLLHLFYTNPNRSFYVREITRKIDEQINSVRRELSNLLSIGIIKSDTSGNRLYYEVNQKYKHYDSLRSMFTNINTKKEKVVAKGNGDLSQRFNEIGSVELVLLTGVFVRNPAVPVDILVVGDINRSRLDKLVHELETEEGHELRYAVFTKDEFDYRSSLKDRFLTIILGAKKTVVLGELPSAKKTKAAR